MIITISPVRHIMKPRLQSKNLPENRLWTGPRLEPNLLEASVQGFQLSQ